MRKSTTWYGVYRQKKKLDWDPRKCCSDFSFIVYEVRPRKDKRGVNLISNAPPFGRLWHGFTGSR